MTSVVHTDGTVYPTPGIHNKWGSYPPLHDVALARDLIPPMWESYIGLHWTLERDRSGMFTFTLFPGSDNRCVYGISMLEAEAIVQACFKYDFLEGRLWNLRNRTINHKRRKIYNYGNLEEPEFCKPGCQCKEHKDARKLYE